MNKTHFAIPPNQKPNRFRSDYNTRFLKKLKSFPVKREPVGSAEGLSYRVIGLGNAKGLELERNPDAETKIQLRRRDWIGDTFIGGGGGGGERSVSAAEHAGKLECFPQRHGDGDGEGQESGCCVAYGVCVSRVLLLVSPRKGNKISGFINYLLVMNEVFKKLLLLLLYSKNRFSFFWKNQMIIKVDFHK